MAKFDTIILHDCFLGVLPFLSSGSTFMSHHSVQPASLKTVSSGWLYSQRLAVAKSGQVLEIWVICDSLKVFLLTSVERQISFLPLKIA